jgi:hypothetical protein
MLTVFVAPVAGAIATAPPVDAPVAPVVVVLAPGVVVVVVAELVSTAT